MAESEFLQFDGRPLVRSGDAVIYGAPWERFYCKLKLVSSDKADQASEVLLAIMDNSIADKAKRIVVKKKCEDLGSAVLFAKNWLDKNDT